MSMFRKKPVVIEARRFDGSNALDLAAWCGGGARTQAKASDSTDIATWVDIPTLEGVMSARPGDWIIRGTQGEFYPCKPDAFAATFEPFD